MISLTQNKLSFLPAISGLMLLVVILSGCSPKVSFEPVKSTVDIPADVFNCKDPIVRPSGDNIMESDVARYINSLEFSQKDCKTRLKEVQVLIECSKKPNCDPKILADLLRVADPSSSR